ncbi:MAG: hypothetical protein PUE12_16625 [Oscillospiraceae bacterium]|nr:hypothetical protein [Oscillospiraceae bacterium]
MDFTDRKKWSNRQNLLKNEVKKSNEIIFVKFYITYELKRERTKHMKETEFKINKKKRNIIIAIVALIVVLAGIITGLVIYNINNKPVETEEPTTETIVVDEPTEETEEPTTSEEPEETEEPTEEVKPTEEPASTEEPSHTHTWSKATCTSPKTCSCGETSGSPLGHSFSNGKCSRCGAKDPNYQEPTPVHTHTWLPATCTSPKTCSGCGATEGSTIGHNFVNHKCTMCNQTECSLHGHDYQDHEETIYHPGEMVPGARCNDCGLEGTIDEIVAHQNSTNHRGWNMIQIPGGSGWYETIHNWICSRCGASK